MNQRHTLLFVVGVFLVIGGVMVGVGAMEYEVKHLETVSEAPTNAAGIIDYDRLSDRDRRIVDRALAGERLTFRDPSNLPGSYEQKGKLAVERDGRYYVLSRRLFFNWRTSYGAAALAMGLAGIATVGEAIRRQHFPHRPVYWVSR
jgi:hypothetical protein